MVSPDGFKAGFGPRAQLGKQLSEGRQRHHRGSPAGRGGHQAGLFPTPVAVAGRGHARATARFAEGTYCVRNLLRKEPTA